MTHLTAGSRTFAPAAPRLAVAVRAAAASDRWVLGAVVAWSAVLCAATWGTWGDLGMDTGYDLLAAARTAHGELPYVDFVYWYGPLGPLLLGGLYSVFGVGVWPAVALGLVVGALAVGLTYRLARLFVAPLPAGLAAGLVATAAFSSANNSYVLPHATSAPLSIVLALATTLALASYVRAPAPGRRRLVLAGVGCGLAAVTRPELALALLAAVTAWLLVRVAGAAGAGRRARWRDAAVVLAPAAAIPLVVYGAFLPGVGTHDLLLENLYPADFVSQAGHVVLREHAPWTPGSVVALAGRTVAYGAALAALAGVAWLLAAGGRRRRLALAALLIGAAGFLAVLLVRPETVRFYLSWAYYWVPAGAVLAVAVLAWRARRPAGRTAGAQAALLLALVLAAATATTYASFTVVPNALHPSAVPYLVPFVAVFLAWVHVALPGRWSPAAAGIGTGALAALVVGAAGLVIHDARAETAEVRGPQGALAARPGDGPALQAALGVIARETRPGEPVLLAPQLTGLYVLADRPNPLPQLSLLPGALATPPDEARAIARMGRVRVAVVTRNPLALYRHGAFGETFDRALGAWLQRDFDRVRTIRGGGPDPRVLDVYRRRTQ